MTRVTGDHSIFKVSKVWQPFIDSDRPQQRRAGHTPLDGATADRAEAAVGGRAATEYRRRIQLASEDAAAASRAISLQRMLETKQQLKINLSTSQSYLNATDTALSSVAIC